jgi:hypothetical protein
MEVILSIVHPAERTIGWKHGCHALSITIRSRRNDKSVFKLTGVGSD